VGSLTVQTAGERGHSLGMDTSYSDWGETCHSLGGITNCPDCGGKRS